MFVSIIIVNYRDYDMTEDCLHSLTATTYPDYEVIVVDNESDPDELEKLARKFPAFHFFGSDQNLYYAGGNNLGIKEARGDLIILLNNDTKVTPGWLEPLVNFARENPKSFCQPQIFFMDRPEVINSAGNTMNVFGFSFPLGIGQKVGGLKEPAEVFYCSGACVAATREALDAVGLLDSLLYNYYEDVNWGWRARLLGIRSFVVPESVIYHKWGGSYSNKLGPKKFFYLERARMVSVLRNFTARTLVVLAPSLLLIDVAMGIYCIKSGMFREKLAAGIDVWKNLGSIMSERRLIQSTRKVSDTQIIRACSREINHPYFDSSPAAKKLLDGLSAACMKLLLLL